MENKEIAKIAQELSKMNDKLDRLIIILGNARKQISEPQSNVVNIGSSGEIKKCGCNNCGCTVCFKSEK